MGLHKGQINNGSFKKGRTISEKERHIKSATAKRNWKDSKFKSGWHHTLKTRKRISETNKRLGRRPPSMKGRKLSPLSKEHKEKIGLANSISQIGRKHTEKTIKKLRELRIGSRNPQWKGGITPELKKIRNSIEIKLWKKSCFERDSFTCQKYKIRGGKLVVHHINNFADFPELRFAIDNGITLSEKAHKEFHKRFGVKNNTKGQLEEFLDSK